MINRIICNTICLFKEKKIESIRAAEKQRTNKEPKKLAKISEPLHLTQTLADFVKKTESKQAEFVEVDDVEESGYKNVVKLDNKTFKDAFKKVLHFYSHKKYYALRNIF